MVSQADVQAQLTRLGITIKFWGRAEIKELPHILVPGEHIHHLLNGRYEGGFAMLVATDLRLLLIDKKPFYLTLEDIRYDMVAEVDYNHRILDSTIIIRTFNKTLSFTSIRTARLRSLTSFTQLRVMEVRQYQHYQSQPNHGQPAQGWQPQQMIAQQTNAGALPPGTSGGEQVASFRHNVINPYTKMPLMMRRRISRFYQ